MKKRLISVLTLAAISMFSLSGCLQVVKTEEGKNKAVVAKVYGEEITKKEFDERFAPVLKNIEFEYKKQEESDAKLKAEGKQIDTTAENRLPADKESFIKQNKEKFLSDLVEEKKWEYNAKQKKVQVTEDELNKAVKEMVDNGVKQYGSEEKFSTEVTALTGLTIDEYKSFIKSTMKMQLLAPKLQEALVKDVKVTDDEAKKEYDSNKYNYTTEPNKLYFSHILIKGDDDKSKAKADQVKKELDGGADFAATAKKYSEDEGSKDNGGNYPDGLEYANLDPSFLEAALKLKNEEISAPVKGQHGYYIIKVHSKKEYPLKKFEDVKEEIKTTLLENKKMTKLQTEVASWEEKAKAKTYPENL